ncbi:hypothetical protein CRG98_022540 [Punica granatum]|uniref:Uncharacterized protein n=1 Tax=Punica granatum TaxID=22663 RepID=A0A2I0JNC1_PUNGR|nr:hypothetical protein CRG98_022540 [Punica granatum]
MYYELTSLEKLIWPSWRENGQKTHSLEKEKVEEVASQQTNILSPADPTQVETWRKKGRYVVEESDEDDDEDEVESPEESDDPSSSDD